MSSTSLDMCMVVSQKIEKLYTISHICPPPQRPNRLSVVFRKFHLWESTYISDPDLFNLFVTLCEEQSRIQSLDSCGSTCMKMDSGPVHHVDGKEDKYYCSSVTLRLELSASLLEEIYDRFWMSHLRAPIGPGGHHPDQVILKHTNSWLAQVYRCCYR